MSAGPAPPYGAAGTEPGTPTTPGAAARAAAARSLSAATSPRELTAREEKCGAGHRRAPVEPRDGLPPSHTHARAPSTPDPKVLGLRWARALRTYPRRQRSQTTPRLPLHTVYAKGSERKSSSPGRSGAKARSPFPLSVVLNFSTFGGSILSQAPHVKCQRRPAAGFSRAAGSRALAPCAHTHAEGRGGCGGGGGRSMRRRGPEGAGQAAAGGAGAKRYSGGRWVAVVQSDSSRRGSTFPPLIFSYEC